MIAIRDCTEQDLIEVQAIYALEVIEGTASFETEPPDVAELSERFRLIKSQQLPFIVAEENNKIGGYAYAGLYRTRPAYRHTVENSVYVARWCRQRGVGLQLLESLIDRVRQGDWREMVAVIGDSGNISSIRLHERAGFDLVGTLKNVGFKHERWLDTVLMQLTLR